MTSAEAQCEVKNPEEFRQSINHPGYVKTPHFEPPFLRDKDLIAYWQFAVIDAVKDIWTSSNQSASLEEIYDWLLKNQRKFSIKIPSKRTIDRRVNEAASSNRLHIENYTMRGDKPELRGIGRVPGLSGNSRYILNPDCHPEIQIVGGA